MKNPFIALLYLSILLLDVSCDPKNSDDNDPEAEEIIEIPEEHFKAALISSNSIETNGDGVGDRDINRNNDGEVQRSEAELIKDLFIHCNNPKINLLTLPVLKILLILAAN